MNNTSSLPIGDFDPVWVPGMGIGTDVSAGGWFVFCKSRCAGVEFYRWFNRTVLIPFFAKVRERFGHKEDELAFFSLDGEPVQIECYSDEELLAELKANHIVVAKPAGSTTEISQAYDRGNLFKAAKTKLASIHDKDIKSDTEMQKRLHEAISNHHRMFDTQEMSSDKRNMCIMGLLRCSLAQQITCRPDMVKDSFKLIGCHPFDLNVIIGNVRLQKKLTGQQLKEIHDVLPLLVECLVDKGEIYDTDIEALQIPWLTIGKSKDDSVIYRRRAVILNHESVIAREKARKLEKVVKSKKGAVSKVLKEAAREEVAVRKEVIQLLSGMITTIDKAEKKETTAIRKEVTFVVNRMVTSVSKLCGAVAKCNLVDLSTVVDNKTTKKRKRTCISILDDKITESVEDLYCFCRRPYDDTDATYGNMVCCSVKGKGCFQWYHYQCIGKEASWKYPKKWICSICTPR